MQPSCGPQLQVKQTNKSVRSKLFLNAPFVNLRHIKAITDLQKLAPVCTLSTCLKVKRIGHVAATFAIILIVPFGNLIPRISYKQDRLEISVEQAYQGSC